MDKMFSGAIADKMITTNKENIRLILNLSPCWVAQQSKPKFGHNYSFIGFSLTNLEQYWRHRSYKITYMELCGEQKKGFIVYPDDDFAH